MNEPDQSKLELLDVLTEHMKSLLRIMCVVAPVSSYIKPAARMIALTEDYKFAKTDEQRKAIVAKFKELQKCFNN